VRGVVSPCALDTRRASCEGVGGRCQRCRADRHGARLHHRHRQSGAHHRPEAQVRGSGSAPHQPPSRQPWPHRDHRPCVCRVQPIAVAAGQRFAAAISGSDTLFVWGEGSAGQLGKCIASGAPLQPSRLPSCTPRSQGWAHRVDIHLVPRW